MTTAVKVGKPVVHFEILGTDGSGLHSFYKDLFGWDMTVHAEMGNYGLVDKATTGTIGGGIGENSDPNARGTVIYIEVDDPQAYLDRAEKLGGKTIIPVETIPGVVTFAQFVDPQGNRVGLVASQTAGN